ARKCGGSLCIATATIISDSVRALIGDHDVVVEGDRLTVQVDRGSGFGRAELLQFFPCSEQVDHAGALIDPGVLTFRALAGGGTETADVKWTRGFDENLP